MFITVCIFPVKIISRPDLRPDAGLIFPFLNVIVSNLCTNELISWVLS